MTHYYSDISHFRAPYKNMVLGGFGAALTELPPGVPGPTEVAIAGLVMKTPDGLIWLKPEVAAVTLKKLEGYNAAFVNDKRVVVAPFTAEELTIAASNPAAAQQLLARSGAAWIQQQVQMGRTVFGSIALALPIIPGGQTELGAVEPSGLADIAKADDGLKQLAPVFAAPSGALATAGMSPVKVGLIAAGVAAGVYVIAKAVKKKR